MPCPEIVTFNAWGHVVRTAVTLSDRWGEQLHALSWSTLDVFGCNPDPLAGRLDRDGLAALLIRSRVPLAVWAVTADAVTLLASDRAVLRYTRRSLTGAVPLWIAYGQEGGP